jgi:hypothetical protein
VPLQLLVLLLGGLLWLHHGLGKEPLLFQKQEETIAEHLDGTAHERFAAAATAHDQAAARRARALAALAAGDGQAAAELRDAAAAAVSARKEARAAIHDHEVAAGRRARDADPPNESNYILPRFLFTEVPAPLLGLMLAAIFAAAISSAAGALSSLTSATMVDFYRRWARPRAADRETLDVSRLVMAVWGSAATWAATSLGDGPLLERVNEIGSWFYGSILGVFVLALFVPRASGVAASIGLGAGFVAVFVVEHSLKVAYLWDNLVGAAACVGAGLLVTAIAPRVPTTTAAPAERVTRGWARTYAKVAVLAVVVMLLLGALSTIGRS